MKKWEYKAVYMRSSIFKSESFNAERLQRECDKQGKDGWELVNFQKYDLGTKFMLIFKKELD